MLVSDTVEQKVKVSKFAAYELTKACTIVSSASDMSELYDDAQLPQTLVIVLCTVV